MEAEACSMVTAAQTGLTPSLRLTLQMGKLRLKEAMCRRWKHQGLGMWQGLSELLVVVSSDTTVLGGVLAQRGSRQLVGGLSSLP